MAIYHHNVSLISRKAGRSATASAAYRAGAEIVDTRTGEVHDYSRKRDVLAAEIIMPKGITWAPDRSELWNAVEHKCKHENAQVAREFLVALPCELSADQRAELARSYAQHLADTYSIAVDLALHDEHDENGNFHAHLLTTTNKVRNHAKPLGNKARELDPIASKRRLDKAEELKTGQPNAVERERVVWCDMANAALERAGLDVCIDHRSYEAQGLDWEPTKHMGPVVAAMERRKPHSTRVGRENREIEERNLVRDLMTQEIEDEENQIWFFECDLSLTNDEKKAVEIEIDIDEREARQAELERQLFAEREEEADRQAAEDEAAQAASDRELKELRAKLRAEEAARRERALKRLQEAMPDQIRRTQELIDEMGVELPEKLRKALEDRGYVKPAEKPEKLPGQPLNSLEHELQQLKQQQDDREDEHQGPGPG